MEVMEMINLFQINNNYNKGKLKLKKFKIKKIIQILKNSHKKMRIQQLNIYPKIRSIFQISEIIVSNFFYFNNNCLLYI